MKPNNDFHTLALKKLRELNFSEDEILDFVVTVSASALEKTFNQFGFTKTNLDTLKLSLDDTKKFSDTYQKNLELVIKNTIE